MGEAPGPLTADDQTMSGLESTPSQRWLVRLSFVLAGRPGIPAPKPPKDRAGLRYLAGISAITPTAPDDRERASHGDRTVRLNGTLRSGHRFEWR